MKQAFFLRKLKKITADDSVLNWICCVLDDAAEYQRMSGRDAIAHDYEKVRKEIDTALQEEDAYYR